MYEHFYGLKEKPFRLLADPSFLYLSKKHELALTYLEYGLSEQAGFIVITGEVGSGKTTLIKYLINKLDKRSIKTALIFNTNITPKEFLEIIVREWGLNCPNKDKTDLYDALNNFLIHEYTNRNSVVLIIDEAQNLSDATLEEIRMLSNLNDEKQPLLHIILLGQPNLRDRLNQKNLEQLRQRISVHYHLEPLDYEDTIGYVKHRLQKAGGQNSALFTPEAIESIYENSRGIPRIINIICDIALVYGFAEGLEQITKPIIENVIEERIKGGLIFFEASDNSNENTFVLENQGLSKEREEIKRMYSLLSKNITDLSLLINRIYSEKESSRGIINGVGNKTKKLTGHGVKKKRRATDGKFETIFERIKSLEKRFHKDTKINRRFISKFLKNTSRWMSPKTHNHGL